MFGLKDQQGFEVVSVAGCWLLAGCLQQLAACSMMLAGCCLPAACCFLRAGLLLAALMLAACCLIAETRCYIARNGWGTLILH